MIDWGRGYSARYVASIVDAVSWRDTDYVDLTEGSIDRVEDGLLESADITVVEKIEGEQWIRIYLEALQEGQTAERVPLFTGLATAPERTLEGTREKHKLECYSVLKPASDILLQRGWYAPAGMAGADIIRDLLSVGTVPVECASGSPVLSQAVVSEDGETNLTMAQKIALAIGWRIFITGSGVIMVEPKPTEEAAVFSSLGDDVLEISVTDSQDWYSCPNVLRAVMDDATAIARDDRPESVLSTVSRGREIWVQEDNITLAEKETLADYVQRRLGELQAPARTISYDRRYHPDVLVGDYIRIHYPAQQLDGRFRVTSQSIDLGYNCKTSEEAVEE